MRSLLLLVYSLLYGCARTTVLFLVKGHGAEQLGARPAGADLSETLLEGVRA
ncbi:MAG: hypothetical protein RBT36_09045 [Desulfobulbus sp.]|jgi:hypothetical protein|nr:hypothetical protein [Desulfobulbus sp.]